MFRVTRPQAFLRLVQSHSVANSRQLASSTRLGPATAGAGLSVASARHDTRSRAISRTWRVEYSTKKPPESVTADPEFERETAKKKLQPRPDEVTAKSSLSGAYERQPQRTGQPAVFSDLMTDITKVKEGLALDSVPRASYLFGFAGTIPYLSTALASLYLTWNLSTPWPTDSNLLNSFLMSHETAHYLLALLEPIQIGYGAVILTFLGAVHWGLELGEKAPAQPRTKFRYAMGLAAPVLAWPTIMLPMQWAMITQFFGFVSLYFADARSTTRGWTPHWYTTYRFVLTAIVGASIVVTLIARASIDNAGSRLTTEDLRHVSVKDQAGPQEYRKWAELEEKERQRLRKEKEKKRAEEEQKKAEEEKEQKGRENKGKDKKHERDEAEEGGEKKSTEQEVDADQKTVQGKDQQKSKDDGGTEAEKKEEKD